MKRIRENLVELLGVVVLFAALCCALTVPRVIFGSLFQSYPLPAFLISFAVLAGIIVTARTRLRTTRRRVAAWVAAGRWIPVPVDRAWPWTSLVFDTGSVVVKQAWQSIIDDLTVTAGELRWDQNALDGAVDTPAGTGVFVEVHLPVETEPMGMRRPHRTIGTSHRLDRPDLNDAFENGEVPPFTAQGRSLFTFEAFRGQLRPEAIDSLIQRTLRLVGLLDLGPDTVTDH